MPERQDSATDSISALSDEQSWSSGPVEESATSTVAGRGPDVLETTREVIEVEESIARQPARDASLTIWLFRRKEAPRQVTVTDLPRLVADDANFVWIDLSDYSERNLREIADALEVPPMAIHTAISRWQRPRLDVYGDQYFVTATIAGLDSGSYRVQAGELDLFVGRNFLMSVHKVPLPLADRVMARARQNPTLMQHDSAYLLYIILDELLEHYEGLNERLQDEVERMEERAIVEDSDDFLEDLLHFKRYAFALSHLADQHREVFSAFLRPDVPFVSGDEMPIYFRDLEGRLSRLLGDLAGAKEAVNGAFDIYVSQVAHRTNHVIKILTIVSSVILPTTVVIGFFGTSFKDVPIYSETGFVLMITIILALTCGILYTLHRRGWI